MKQRTEYFREWRAKNKERVAANHIAWREKNRIWLKVYTRLWYHRTKDKRNAYLRSYYRSRIDHFRQQSSKNSSKRRVEIMTMLGGAFCVKCSFSDLRALQIDHVNGGGGRMRRSHGWSYKFWKKEIKESPEKYQVLCANCNWIKRYENRELDRCQR